MQPQNTKTAKISLISEIRNVTGLYNVTQASYILKSKNSAQNFPHINFTMTNKIQAGDDERRFFVIPITEDEQEHSLEPFQYFPKKLITEITLKNSALGRNIYLMECVSSPLFIHRKHDVIKMSIDFKGSEILDARYQHFFEKDVLGVIINTVDENHMSLVNLRNLRILNHVVTEREPGSTRKLKIVSSFLGGANESLLMGVNDRGKFYWGNGMVFDPGFCKLFLKFF